MSRPCLCPRCHSDFRSTHALKQQASIQAYVTDGVITEQELENCTPEQLEFLIRKRSPGPAGAASGDGGAANVVPWSSPGKVGAPALLALDVLLTRKARQGGARG